MKELIALNCTLNPTMITVLPEYAYTDDFGSEFLPGRTLRKIESDTVNLAKKRVYNIVSKKSRKKINSVVNWLVYAARKKKGLFSQKTGRIHKWRVNFITLTLQSGWHKDSELFRPAYDPIEFRMNTDERMYDMDAIQFKKKLLNPFLTYGRKYWDLRNYVWKIENTKKGTIHIHITTDTFIPWWLIRKQWNGLLKSNGLLERYANWSREEHPERSVVEHYDPNSIDVHAQKKLVKNMAAYLCKEMTKSDGLGKRIEGRLWGCNYELSRAMNQRISLFVSEDNFKDAANLSRIIKDYKEIMTQPNAFGERKQIGECYFPNPRDWLNEKMGVFREVFLNTLYQLRSGEHTNSLFYTFENVKSKELAPVAVKQRPRTYIQYILNLQ